MEVILLKDVEKVGKKGEVVQVRDGFGRNFPQFGEGAALNDGEKSLRVAMHRLGRVKMGWDFVEGCPLSGSSGSFEKCTDNLAAGVVATDVASSQTGQTVQAMAQRSPIPDDSASV